MIDKSDDRDNGLIYNFSKTALYVFVISIFSVAAILLIYMAFSTKDHKVVYVNENVVLNDIVYLNENNYFDEDFLTNQNKYITELIKSIELEYKYDLTLSDFINYDISYYADATLSIYELDHPENVLWSKEETLIKKEVKQSGEVTSFKLNENIDINYNEYDKLVKEFVKDYVLITDSVLEVNFHIIMDSKDDKYSDDFDREKVITVKIPMNEQTISITKSYDNLVNSSIVSTDTVFNAFSITYLVLGILLFGLDVFCLYKLFIQVRDNNFRRTPYQKALDKILRTYDQIIVSAKTKPNFEGLNKIEVNTFEELLDAQEELRIPIVHYESSKDKESIFVIIDDNNVWIYYLKEMSYMKWS